MLRFRSILATFKLPLVAGSNMPRCSLDEDLLQRARAVVAMEGGNAAAASLALGINRTKFWRFLRSGRALSTTRADMARRLDEHLAKTETKMQPRDGLAPRPSSDDLHQLRAFCLTVMTLIDFYDAAHAPKAESAAGATSS